MITTAYLQVNNGSGFHVPWKDVAAVVNRVHGTTFTPAATARAFARYMDRELAKAVLARINKQDDALLAKLAEIEAKAAK